MNKKFTKKQLAQDAAEVVQANARMHYEFKHEVCTYTGHETATHESSCKLAVGELYVIVDRNCESHFVPLYAFFDSIVTLGQWSTDKWMLFRAQCDGDGHKKNDYFLVKPTVRLDGYQLKDFRMKLELSAFHHLGPNKNRKIVIREAEEI